MKKCNCESPAPYFSNPNGRIEYRISFTPADDEKTKPQNSEIRNTVAVILRSLVSDGCSWEEDILRAFLIEPAEAEAETRRGGDRRGGRRRAQE